MADGFVVDGKTYSVDDLTFREQRDMRKLARELVEDPAANIEDMALVDVLPALITVIARRDNPEFSLEDALDMKMADVVPDEDDEERPTEPAEMISAKASGRAGTRK